MTTQAPLSLQELASLLVVSERETKRWTEDRDKLRAEVLERMDRECVGKLELLDARVSYIAPGPTETVDVEALKAKLEALGARLRDLGAHEVDDAIPMKSGHRKASLRVTARL